MDQDPVDIATDAIDNLAMPPRIVAHDDDIAHRAKYWRLAPWSGASGRDQRIEFEAKGTARERKCFEDNRVGPGSRKGREQRIAALLAQGIVDGLPSMVDQRETCVARAQRWELDSVTAGSCGKLCFMPPETTVTAMSCSTRASAICSARWRCPIPSRCCTQNRTERFPRAFTRRACLGASRGSRPGAKRPPANRARSGPALVPPRPSPPPVGIEDQRRNAAAKAIGSPGGTSLPVSRSATMPRDAAARPGHDRQPAGLRFEQRHAERLVYRRPDEQVGIGESGGDRRLVERAAAANSGAERGQRRRDLAARLAIADDIERPVQIGQHRKRGGEQAIGGELVAKPHHRDRDQAGRREGGRGRRAAAIALRRGTAETRPSARDRATASRRNRDRRD